jgi:hypothetical protein
MPSDFKVYNLLSVTADILTELAEKTSWDPANRRPKLDLVWENILKIIQI